MECGSAYRVGMEDLYQRLEEIISYAVKVLPLANAHIVNFFTHDLWEVYLPSSIRTELAGCDMNVAFDLIWHHWKFGLATNALPALSQFLDRAASMSVGSQDGIALTMEDLQEKLCSWGFGNREGLKFEQFMPRKKTHEVEVMSYLVSNMALLTSTSRIVDIGGGKGYLGSLLALEYNLKVLGLDSSKAKTSGVERRAKKLEEVWRRVCKRTGSGATDCGEDKMRAETLGEYKQLTSFVNDTTDVAGMVRQEFPGGGDGRATMGLIGLHTCGTLASACLRHFVRDEASYDFLINVGCCYNLMEEVDYAAPHEAGRPTCAFPMSSYLRRRRFGMGRNARMLALQAKPRLSLLETLPSESLVYRAMLQQLLVNKIGADKIPKVGRLAEKCSSDFHEYVRKTIDKFNLDVKISDDEVQEVFDKCIKWEARLRLFLMLRISLAPVLEHIILLDRLLFLKEQGIQHSYLVRMFDPVVSPRCYGIVAFRDRSHSLPL